MTPSPCRPPWWDSDCLDREREALKRLKERRDRQADSRQQARVGRMFDAEFECVHGNLRIYLSREDPCGCWPDDVLKARWRQVWDEDGPDAQDAA